MGRVKDYFIDKIVSQQAWISNVKFTCPSCSELIVQSVAVPEPNYAAEKSRDMTVDGEVAIECEHCGEYLEGNVWAGPHHCDIELRKYPNTSVLCDPPGYDSPPEDENWLYNWPTPEHPKEVFEENHRQLLSMIEQQVQKDGSSLMNRMVFAQIITFLEAYLCDTLIMGLRNNREFMISFAEKDGSIKQMAVSASSVLRDPDYVRRIIEQNLKERLYHKFGPSLADANSKKSKLEGVPLWYGTAFGFSIAASEKELDALRDYATLRHDCIHRNGETKDGKKLDLFTKDYLLSALNVAKQVVEHIENKMKELKNGKDDDSSVF